MKKIILFLSLLTFFNLALICEEHENLYKATNYYESDNYTNALEYYVKAVQTGESNTGTTYYRLAYSWENVNPNASKYFSKFYSIAAYCFERDNDTENKYYSYSINKEEKFNTNHDNLNENKIEKIINKDLTQKKIDYRKGKENKKSDAPVIILALIIGLFCTSKFGNKSGKSTSTTTSNTNTTNKSIKQNIKFYCKYCGTPYSDLRRLTADKCHMHPMGRFNGYHSPFEGVKNDDKYYCKYCGTPYSDLRRLTADKCPKHPKGRFNGYHSPFEGVKTSNGYYCAYCGTSYSDLRRLTADKCPKHPDGRFNGFHFPYEGK